MMLFIYYAPAGWDSYAVVAANEQEALALVKAKAMSGFLGGRERRLEFLRGEALAKAEAFYTAATFEATWWEREHAQLRLQVFGPGEVATHSNEE